MAVLPLRCRRYLVDGGILFKELQTGDQKAVVLRDFALPTGRFDAPAADILILLPSGYPDGAPDMFYTRPWLRLTSTGTYPNRADQAFDFNGDRWQRWSRHNSHWRAGIDGIWIMIRRIATALEEAN